MRRARSVLDCLITQRRPGAYLGHEAGDNKGQQRCPAGSRDLALTSGEGSEQRRSPGHTVYGMQVLPANALAIDLPNEDAPTPMNRVDKPLERSSLPRP
jgi:hypothetical protein